MSPGTEHLTEQLAKSSSIVGMELSGFEPLTFSMPLRRATNCAIAPYALTMMPRHGAIRQLL